MITSAEEVTIFTRLVSEVPLVIAFVFFSLRIIALFTSIQERQLERQGEMIKAINAQWMENERKRDAEMQAFLASFTDQNKTSTSALVASINAINANVQALEHSVSKQSSKRNPNDNPPAR